MPEPLTLEELTKLVHEKLIAVGLSEVRFAIRPLLFELLNWGIHFQPQLQLREEERNALTTIGRELREKHYLLLGDWGSPYAA